MKRLLLFVVLLLQFCSYENPYTARMKANYFPIDKTGNFWIYKNELGNEKYIEAKENMNNISKDGREVIILEENYNETYWYKGDNFISRYRDIEISFNGQPVIVESRWQNYIEIPPIKGNSWNDTWKDTILFLNKPLYRTDNLEGSVLNYETLRTDAGEFKNCYRIKLTIFEKIESEVIGDSLVQKIYFEWYAPDVGLVKSTEDNENWELVTYGSIEDGD